MLHFFSRIIFLFLTFFFFNDPATTEIYTLSLHDALPTYPGLRLFPDTVRHVFGERERPPADVAHYSTKQRIVPDGAAAGARVPLRCVYTIAAREPTAETQRLRIEPRSRRDAILDLVG